MEQFNVFTYNRKYILIGAQGYTSRHGSDAEQAIRVYGVLVSHHDDRVFLYSAGSYSAVLARGRSVRHPANLACEKIIPAKICCSINRSTHE